jgi:type IV pilus assembly protein PilM
MDNPLTKLFETIRRGLSQKKSDNSVLGIDIGFSSAKVVQLRKSKGQAVLETYGELYLGPYANKAIGQSATLPPEKMVEALKDLFKAANVTATRAAISIPLRSSLIVLMDIPSLGEKQVNEIVPIEARKYIPVPVSEVMLDWWVIPKKETLAAGENEAEPTQKVEVLMVAIHNNVLKQYRELASAAGLDVRTFEIETFSAIRAVFGHDMQATMVLDVGASSAKVTIVDFGIVRASHVINKGGQDITFALSKSTGVSFGRAEEIKRESGILGETGEKNISGVASPVIEYIFFEANKVISAYQKKYQRAVSKVILTGGGSLLKGLSEVAARNFEVEVVFGNPFGKVEAPAFLENVLRGVGPEFAVAVGLALRELQGIE